MIDGFIYEMPCLSKYRFNHKGECIHVRTGNIKQLLKRGAKTPAYDLEMDNGKSGYVTITEALQYIKHLKAEMEYNPLTFHHFVYYRPIIRHTREGKYNNLKTQIR